MAMDGSLQLPLTQGECSKGGDSPLPPRYFLSTLDLTSYQLGRDGNGQSSCQASRFGESTLYGGAKCGENHRPGNYMHDQLHIMLMSNFARSIMRLERPDPASTYVQSMERSYRGSSYPYM